MNTNMAYIAIDKDNHCFAICSADPDYMAKEGHKDISGWKKQGARIELLPVDEAKAKFCETL